MSRGVRASFYRSQAWKSAAAAYKKSVGGLCEKCYARGLVEPGAIVHHKIHLTDDNLDNQEISLSFSNLELLCRKCHAEEHEDWYKRKQAPRRWEISETGEVIISEITTDSTPPDKENT